MEIEVTDKFKQAITLIEGNTNLFITGKAGTGKSTLLRYFRKITSKKIVVLAPTGVAALNVQGQTIHSFFRFKPDITVDKVKKKILKDIKSNIYSKLDIIIIDEISMVRADLLDCVDKFMQLNCGKRMPFGGKQTIFFGDLYQLPPVIPSQEKIMFKEKYKTGYFFSSEVMKELPFKIVELDKIFRQKERSFIEILNAIRNNTVTEEMLNKLNNRFMPDFEPEADSFYIFLTTRNDKVFKINQERLKQLSGEEYTFNAQVRGKFDKATYPTDEVLHIKEEAQVMLLNNDSKKRWVNGSIGKVIMVIPANDTIMVQLTSGDVVEVTPYEWDIFKYFYNSDTDTIETEQVGYFKQFPLRLSWAITIHKAQGKTFDNVIFDIGSGAFTPGQVYVGLSRCATLDGLVLKKKIRKQDIFIDRDIVNFMTEK